MSRRIVESARGWLGALLLGGPVWGLGDEPPARASAPPGDQVVFSIEVSNETRLDDIGEGGFDAAITGIRRFRFYSGRVRDCVGPVESALGKWLRENGSVLVESVAEAKGRYVARYRDARRGGSYELRYRVDLEGQRAEVHLYRLDDKGLPGAVAPTDPNARLVEALRDAMRCGDA